MLWLLIFSITFQSSHGNYQNLYEDFSKQIEKALNSSAVHQVSYQCREQLLNYTEGLKIGERWALKMFDSEGKIPSGILDGNEADLGSFDECLNVVQENTIYGKYCLATATLYVKINSDEKESQTPVPKIEVKVQLAKCFPNGCSLSEMQQIYNEIGLDLQLTKILCQTKIDKPALDVGAIATLSFFGLIIGIVILSTSYDICIHYLKKKPAHIVFVAFSAFTNVKKLIQTSKGSNDISCLNGLRVLSTMWIIFIHLNSILLGFPLKNSFIKSNWTKYEGNMFMISGTLAVDTFFLLAGLLIVYNYLKTSNKGMKFNIFLYYLHRYLRLTPVLLIVMLFYITLLKHIGSGPLWPLVMDELVLGCEMQWWKLLLYIQNISGRGQPMCISHSWYLCVDMQLFILSPFLLIPLKKWPRLTLMTTISLALSSMVACFCIAWFFELNAFMSQNNKFGFDRVMDYVWYYYFTPHARAAPWLIGIVLGYFVFQAKEGKLNPVKNKIAISIFWVVSLAVLCICVFAGHALIIGNYNRLANSFHIALVRPVWSVAIACVIFACVTGSGGPVEWFLSLPVFQVVSRLTYTLYIVHYSLIFVIRGQMRVVPVYNNFQLAFQFWAYFALVFVLATILTIAIEFPVITLDNCLIRRKKIS